MSPRLSEEAVRKATGRSWDEWFTIIDNFGGEKLSHKQIAQTLFEKAFIPSGWWCQSVTVEYEKARGRRMLGETAASGFEVGVSRTFAVTPVTAWETLVSPKGLRVWLGDTAKLSLEPGAPYSTKEGTTGEVRTVKPGERLRVRWHPTSLRKPSTLQVTVMPAQAKSTISFHQEQLSSAKERETMRANWQRALADLEKLFAEL